MNGVLTRLVRDIRPYRGRVATVAVFGVIWAVASSRLVFIIQGLIDSVRAGETDALGRLNEVGAQGVALALVIAVSRYVHIFNMNMVAEKVVNDLRMKLQSKFMGLSLGFHANYESGSGGLMSRILNDVKVIQDGLRMVADLFMHPLLAILLLGQLFWLNWRLTLTIMIVLPFVLYFLREVSRSLKRHVLSGQEQLEHITSTIKESLDGVRTIQSFNLESEMSGKLRRQSDEYLGIRAKVHSRIEIMGPVTELIATIVVLAIFYYFGSEAAKGNVTPGQIIGYIAAMMMMNAPIKKLQESYVRVQETVVAAGRVYALVDDIAEVPSVASPKPFPADWSKIVYRNVSFSYGDQLNLTDVNLEIRRGQRVAFVGESGSGKSTLVNLLTRFYDPTSGEILIDDEPIRNFDLQDLRRHVAMVSQDVFLFSDTVERNINSGDFSKPTDGVIPAAKSANADAFISRMPERYRSRVGDRGGLLSGGEKQRVSIARAIFKDAPILIMDEATSALDSASEKEVQKGLETLMRGRTSLVVAHRLSTIQEADRIYVLRKGRIVGQGKHDELLATSEEYRRFWTLQTAPNTVV